ncbi:MAG: alkaline phosphatase D family protein, partial [Candidatus Sericytochromatia bacterium]|nr:alkaline phosphatase D family protein [Candidatus Tanganyikabacteria bacterium]
TASDGSWAGGKFRTPARLGDRRPLRFGATGDWSQDLAPYPAIRNMAARDLDALFLLGDSIYADHGSPDQPTIARTLPEFRRKYLESLKPRNGLNTWPEARASTAVFATIDDHEVVNDFAGAAATDADPRFADEKGKLVNQTAYYREGLQAFHDYMPLQNEVWPESAEARFAGRPRLYRHRTFGSDAACFLLDARSFRDTPLNRVFGRDPLGTVNFLFSSAWPGRTMLGRSQVALLQADLLAAQQAGITWKFVFVPEPIQALGVIAANDRFEGYAAERAELLSFVRDKGLTNVVFVTADFHGTLVNNLVYSWFPLTPSNKLNAWEIITGPVAVEPVLGAGIVAVGAKAGLVTAQEKAAYDAANRAGKDLIIKGLVDRQLRLQMLDPIGLQDSGIPAALEAGDYVAVHTFGWTEFEVQGPELVVTTWGIEAYTDVDLAADPAGIAAREPQVVSRIRVKAVN